MSWRMVLLDRRIITKELRRQLKDVNDPTTMIAVYNTLAKKCDPYVPFLEGPLSQTVRISSEGVRYIQPYARYQYYGAHFNHTTDYHPLASAQWDKAMMRDHRQEFSQEVKEIIRWRIKQSGR